MRQGRRQRAQNAANAPRTPATRPGRPQRAQDAPNAPRTPPTRLGRHYDALCKHPVSLGRANAYACRPMDLGSLDRMLCALSYKLLQFHRTSGSFALAHIECLQNLPELQSLDRKTQLEHAPAINTWVHTAKSIWSSQRSLHNTPIFRLLLKVAVNGTHQCDSFNFCGSFGPQHFYMLLHEAWTR